MKINPRELRDKGIEYCKAHENNGRCDKCSLRDHEMSINTEGILSMTGYDADLINFFRYFQKMVNVIYGEEAADDT